MFREFFIFPLVIVKRGNTLQHQPNSNLTTVLISPTGLIKITAENATVKGSFYLNSLLIELLNLTRIRNY